MRLVDRSAVDLVKEAKAEKSYRAWIRFDGALPRDAAARIESLAGQEVEQYSPTRVMHRRGPQTLRRRRVLSSSFLGEIDRLAVWEVRAQSGTYIKELISGDGGRTRPSIAAALCVPATCMALDVIDVDWRAPWEDDD